MNIEEQKKNIYKYKGPAINRGLTIKIIKKLNSEGKIETSITYGSKFSLSQDDKKYLCGEYIKPKEKNKNRCQMSNAEAKYKDPLSKVC